MKQRLKPLGVSLCLLSMVSTEAFATDSATSENIISSRTQHLEAQLNQLQAEVASLKRQVQSEKKASNNKKTTQHVTPTHTEISPKTTTVGSKNTPTLTDEPNYFPIDLDVPGQSFVSSGPYLGIPLQYSGSNLIINNPSVDQDVALLNIRKGIHNRLEALGVKEEDDHAHVLLSGIVEGQAMYKQIGGGPDSTGIDLTSAGLDAYILGPSSWISSLIALSYDNNLGSNSGSFNSNSRVQNSRTFINQAFVTIGNFTHSPFYGTFGQFYVPFGTYSSNMVSSPLTKLMARTKARAIVFGYQQQSTNAFYGSTYIFQGDTYTGSTSTVNNGGINLGYRFKKSDNVSGNIGGGIIANLADSVGMQDTGYTNPQFGGFGGIGGSGSEQIVHRVAAYDLRALISLYHFDILAEYITAAQSFSANDLTMNGSGALPQALNAEVAYSFEVFTKPTSIAVGYGMAKDVLALGIPKQRYSFVVNTSIWKDTLQSLELRHDVNYRTSDSATGSVTSSRTLTYGVGQPNNIITAQFDVYF